jgi:hypothetical protein
MKPKQLMPIFASLAVVIAVWTLVLVHNSAPGRLPSSGAPDTPSAGPSATAPTGQTNGAGGSLAITMPAGGSPAGAAAGGAGNAVALCIDQTILQAIGSNKTGGSGSQPSGSGASSGSGSGGVVSAAVGAVTSVAPTVKPVLPLPTLPPLPVTKPTPPPVP